MSPGLAGRASAGALVADRHGAVEDLCDFIGNGGCAFVGRLSDCHSEDRFVNGRRRPRNRARPGNRSRVFVGEAARSGVGLRHLREDVVDEMQQARAPRESCAQSTGAAVLPAAASGCTRRRAAARQRRRRGNGRWTASDRRRRRSTDSRRARAPRPTPGRAATRAPTGPGSCPGTRRRARGDTAIRGGSGSARTRPSAAAAAAPSRARRRNRGRARSSSARRYWSSATANIRRTPRASTTLRSRLNANITRSTRGAAARPRRGAASSRLGTGSGSSL